MHALLAAFDEHRIPYRESGQHHHIREGWIGIDCPWCGRGSSSWHLGIQRERLTCRCWRCGRKWIGDVLNELGLPWDTLRSIRGQIVTRNVEKTKPRGRLVLPPGLEDLSRPHRRWIKGRGMVFSRLESIWGLRGIGRLGGRLAWRIWAPITLNRETVSWQTRRINDEVGGKRWLSANPEQEAVPLRELIYGLDHVRHAALICEGLSDCWRLGPGAVACLGMGGITEAQIAALSTIPIRAVCFDDEPRAQIEAAKLASRLAEMPGETYRVELVDGSSGMDPGEASYKKIKRLRAEILGDKESPDWIIQ